MAISKILIKQPAIRSTDFDFNADICGLKGKCRYNQTIIVDKKHFRLLGFNTKAPQYSLICKEAFTGKYYRLPKTVLDR